MVIYMDSKKVKLVVRPAWWKVRRRNAIITMIGNRKLKTNTTTNFFAAGVFKGRTMKSVQATTAASRMASIMHTAFRRVYTWLHCSPSSLQGWDGSHCSADEKTAPNAHSAVAIMMPYAIRRCDSIGVRRRTKIKTQHLDSARESVTKMLLA